jgi:GDPmannose 4,6-dehydratase
MAKTALITGITGQDGQHLAELLISKGYETFGLVTGSRNLLSDPVVKRFPQIKLLRGDLADFSSLLNVINETQPDEIYNLGALSSVGLSFSQPELTANVTGLGLLRILEATRKLKLEDKTRIYQASSPEMFGKVRETPQSELTPFYPQSPYGIAKAFAHHTCIQYRESYGMFISAGILFNHEGENRGHEFVTRKISSSVARIKLGKQERFSLGNISPSRDWGYAGDYVEAMWLMLQQEEPDDFVIATGESHTIKEFVMEALEAAGLEADIEKYLDYDPSMIRPREVDTLIGDASKAFRKLGWKPKVTFQELVRKMVENDLQVEAER